MGDFTLPVPQAQITVGTPILFWRPRFKMSRWLSSALSLLKEIVDEVIAQGITEENIYFAGFSQGACLTLEFVARHAIRNGGVVAFTGGLIGDRIYKENYQGDFKNTPFFIGSSNPDPHVPVERVYAITNILKRMNAVVLERYMKT